MSLALVWRQRKRKDQGKLIVCGASTEWSPPFSPLHCFKLWCQEWLSHLPTITWWMDLGVFVSTRVGRVGVVVVAWVFPSPTHRIICPFSFRKNFSHPPSPRTVVNVTPLIIKNLIKIDFFSPFGCSRISYILLGSCCRAQLTSHIAHT